MFMWVPSIAATMFNYPVISLNSVLHCLAYTPAGNRKSLMLFSITKKPTLYALSQQSALPSCYLPPIPNVELLPKTSKERITRSAVVIPRLN